MGKRKRAEITYFHVTSFYVSYMQNAVRTIFEHLYFVILRRGLDTGKEPRLIRFFDTIFRDEQRIYFSGVKTIKTSSLRLTNYVQTRRSKRLPSNWLLLYNFCLSELFTTLNTSQLKNNKQQLFSCLQNDNLEKDKKSTWWFMDHTC